MEKINEQNFDYLYSDPIEVERIDKFVSDEMDRQVHRYIKAMKGSKDNMLRFIASLKDMTTEDKEHSIATYIDYNRKVISGLDFRIVLARAMANYCDTFEYFQTMLADERKFSLYLVRIKSKYIRFHSVFEKDGKFGMVDYKGDILIPAEYDFLRTCYVYVDSLTTMPVIAEREGKMGLILPDGKGTVVADFKYDDIYLSDEYPYFEGRKNGRKKIIDVTYAQ